MITLDAIALGDSMVWRERYQSQGVAQSVRPTLGGVPVVFSQAIEKGTKITLATYRVGGNLYGALRRSVLTQVLARAAVPGAVYVLNFNGSNYDVIFRHEEAPAVDMTPVYARVADEADDYFEGEIKLLTV